MASNQTLRILKKGDPLLKKICKPVMFPFNEQVDQAWDDCIEALVNFDRCLKVYREIVEVFGIREVLQYQHLKSIFIRDFL